MKLNPWAKCIKVRTLFFILVAALLPSASQAAFKSSLQGQNAGSTNWTGGPLTGYKELDFVPARTLFTGGPATNQVITVDFDHSKSSGTLKGIEDLSNFTNSSNVLITSGPTLSTPNTDIWRYTFTITITNALDGFVEFRARLAAGSHLFTGSSLNLSSPTLSIFKPSAEPGFPDLAIAKRGPSQAKPGQIITYTINYTNLASAATVAKGVQVSDVLPSAVTYVPGSASKGATLVGNTLTWDLGNINPGKRGLLTYKVVVSTNIPLTTTFANFAQILGSQDDANTADNTASVTTTVVVNPTLVANDDFYATDKYIPLSIPAPGVLTNDVSSVTNALTAVLVSIPDNGSLVFNADGSFLYTPLTNFVGVDQFAYVITVGTNTSGPAVVNINVTNSCDIVVTNLTVGNDAGQCGAIV
ncbi:MAG TPA: Ig-like domain-containing protein, partial [Methylomirabilota bacterium]|nr:Ig-like domain-containing protein [Methylomirabilota bacterium]